MTRPIKADVILFRALAAASALPADVIKVRPESIRVNTAAIPANSEIIFTAVCIVSKTGFVVVFLASTHTVLLELLLQDALKGSNADTFTEDTARRVVVLSIVKRKYFNKLLNFTAFLSFK